MLSKKYRRKFNELSYTYGDVTFDFAYHLFMDKDLACKAATATIAGLYHKGKLRKLLKMTPAETNVYVFNLFKSNCMKVYRKNYKKISNCLPT